VGEAGDNIGALLRGVGRDAVERGQVLCKPGSVKPHTKFEAEAYILTKEEGGRHTPFFANYRPQFYFRTTDVTGTVTLAAGTEMVMPGDNVSFTVELIAPIAMEDGLRFAIREGGRTVGAGVVPERPPCKGCGCKGGPGYRINATGKCAGFKALERQCGNPPTLRCTFENAPGTGLNRNCALGKNSDVPG
jgi:hypothetical protein